MRKCAIILIAQCCVAAGLVDAGPSTKPASESKFRIGRIRALAISESSGLVASRRHPGVFWTINDSGNAPILYAISQTGDLIREFPVAAENTDWEDLAIDDAGRLYIADMGNNSGERKQVRVLRVDEPDPRAPVRGKAAPLRVAASWRLDYPDKPFDCEALFVLNDKGYVMPKRLASAAEVYAFDLAPASRAVKLERVAELPAVRAPVTAADVSPDGKRLAVLTVFGPYLFDIERDITRAAKATPRHSRYILYNMEAACFAENGLLVTTESRDILLFRDEHFK
jgi:hypothetical protein